MQSRKNFIFIAFCLGMLILILQVYSFFANYFSDSRDLVAQAHQLQEQVEREKLHTAMVKNHLLDLRQEIATSLPISNMNVKNLADYRLKELTETLRSPASDRSIELSSVLMEKGKDAFKKQNYEQAVHAFREVVEKYPTSAVVIDAHFLLGESLYQISKYDDCLDVVYDMVNHFPQNEMTGYLMLRNAQILASRKRNAEASEILHLIIQKFTGHANLKEQARRLASEM